MNPLVLPEARSGGTLVLASYIEAFLEELVGENSRLQKSVNATTNFEIDPAVADAVGERLHSKMNSSGMLERRTGTYSGRSGRVQRWRLLISKVVNLVPWRERRLLIMSLRSLRGAVLVPISPG